MSCSETRDRAEQPELTTVPPRLSCARFALKTAYGVKVSSIILLDWVHTARRFVRRVAHVIYACNRAELLYVYILMLRMALCFCPILFALHFAATDFAKCVYSGIRRSSFTYTYGGQISFLPFTLLDVGVSNSDLPQNSDTPRAG